MKKTILEIHLTPKTNKISFGIYDQNFIDRHKDEILAEMIIKLNADLAEIEAIFSAKLFDDSSKP
jgi:hypothetical protein